MSTIPWFLVYSQICAAITPVNLGTFSSLQKEILDILAASPYTPIFPTQSWATAVCLCSFSCPGLSQEWNHDVCGLCAWLLSLSMFSRFVHVTCPHFTPFYGWIVFRCMVNHILFIHSSIGGHLYYFYLLAVVNNGAINTCLQGFVWTYVFTCFGYIPRCGLAVSCSSMFNHLRN